MDEEDEEDEAVGDLEKVEEVELRITGEGRYEGATKFSSGLFVMPLKALVLKVIFASVCHKHCW